MAENIAKKSIGEILADIDDTENIVLADSDGVETEFEQVAVVGLDDGMYCILSPLENGVASDEGVVFAFDNTDGEETLVLVEDDEKIDEVFAYYARALDEEK